MYKNKNCNIFISAYQKNDYNSVHSVHIFLVYQSMLVDSEELLQCRLDWKNYSINVCG